MKKFIALFLSLLLMLAFTVGCKPAETPIPEEPMPVEEPTPAPTPVPEEPIVPEKPVEEPAK
ncbi:MAG: hypothetical protein IBX72_07070 [Nitrospirae bacterium]|nr:hypothetical protein [Nitrospirota bacterium]